MPIRTCRDVYDAASDAIDGSLSSMDQAAYDTHLAMCPPCVDFDRGLRRVIAAARTHHASGADESVPDDVAAAFAARLQELG